MERLDFDGAYTKIEKWKSNHNDLAFIPDVVTAYLQVAEGEFKEAEETFSKAVIEMRSFGMAEDFIAIASENFFTTADEIKADYLEGYELLLGKKRGLVGRLAKGAKKGLKETAKFAITAAKKVKEVGTEIAETAIIIAAAIAILTK